MVCKKTFQQNSMTLSPCPATSYSYLRPLFDIDCWASLAPSRNLSTSVCGLLNFEKDWPGSLWPRITPIFVCNREETSISSMLCFFESLHLWAGKPASRYSIQLLHRCQKWHLISTFRPTCLVYSIHINFPRSNAESPSALCPQYQDVFPIWLSKVALTFVSGESEQTAPPKTRVVICLKSLTYLEGIRSSSSRVKWLFGFVSAERVAVYYASSYSNDLCKTRV